jgi:PPP family 3-phenylpropionic acid transporter
MALIERRFSRTANAFHYFLYFAVMGIYLPYFNLYCYHLGFTGFHIGVLSALRAFTMVAFPMLWGALADRLNGQRPIYIVCTTASAAIWAVFLLTEDFASMAALTLFYGAFYAPIIAFLEAFTMENLGGEKRRYGSIRVWGSISFIAVVLAFGPLIELFSVRLVVPAILFGLLALAAAAWTVPAATAGPKRPTRGQLRAWRKPQAVFFLACGFLMLVSHGAYYGFLSIHLETLGFSGTFIGANWALASAAEIVVMVFSGAIFGRFALERVIGVSFAAAVLRWAVLGTATSPAAILLAQVLHAFTYGTFHMASVLYIDRLAPPESKTLAQALNNALTYGLGLMVGFFLNGALYGVIGSFGLFQASSLIAVLGGALFALFQKLQSRRVGENA